MSGLIVVAVLVATGLIIYFHSHSKTEHSASWVQFYTMGTDADFSFREIEMLRHLAAKANIENPASIFWSQIQLDHCIRALTHDINQKNISNESESQDFLAKLYEFRKKVSITNPDGKNGIANSRQISEGQNIQIHLEGYGVFKSQIIKNTGNHLVISRPNSAKLPGIFTWPGQRISVYFWREEDAGYVFDADVLDEIFSENVACLKIAHADSLARTQKRKSIRVKLHKSAFLYPLKNEENASKIETSAGLKCLLEDLSDSGCALTVGGKAEPGLRIKIQFALNNAPVVISGTVRHTEYKADNNKSQLHVEADPMTIEVRNRVLGEVFGMLSEDEEDLPFRILDEDGQNPPSENSPPIESGDLQFEDMLSGENDMTETGEKKEEVVIAEDIF